jgi:hypothetical protein
MKKKSFLLLQTFAPHQPIRWSSYAEQVIRGDPPALRTGLGLITHQNKKTKKKKAVPPHAMGGEEV